MQKTRTTNHKPDPPPRVPPTIDQVRDLRAKCEAEVMCLLAELCNRTGLDLRRVEVLTVAAPDRRDSNAPRVKPFAVRIDITV